MGANDFIAAAFGLVFVLACPRAEAASPDDDMDAQRLFDAGVDLKAHGRLAEGCPKLEQSQRLDPGIGTQYHLADCYEKQGRMASAWLIFQDIAKQAAVSGQADRERVARARGAEIAPFMSHLMVAVPISSDAAGLEVSRDGVRMEREKWNTPLPVDPGPHVIAARVGDRTWRKTVTFGALSRTEQVTVPSFNERSVVTNQRFDTRKKVGLGLGMAGLVGFGLGAGFVATSLGDRPEGPVSTDVGAVMMVTGAVVGGAGLYLLVSSPRASRRGVMASAGPLGFQVRGAFQ